MKPIILFTFGIFMASFVFAQNTEIKFHKGTWNEALEIAKNENKPIFLDISTNWCRYCKKMKAIVYKDTLVANYYNSNFINVIIDAEKGEGPELTKKYGVKSYPTLIFLNADGTISGKVSGYKNPEKFLELGKNKGNKK